MTAIDWAAQLLLLLPPEPTTFFEDSQSALRAVVKPESTSALVWQCKKSLGRLLALAPVSLHWVKAHMGHALYKEALSGPSRDGVFPPCGCGSPWKFIERQLRDKLKSVWTE